MRIGPAFRKEIKREGKKTKKKKKRQWSADRKVSVLRESEQELWPSSPDDDQRHARKMDRHGDSWCPLAAVTVLDMIDERLGLLWWPDVTYGEGK